MTATEKKFWDAIDSLTKAGFQPNISKMDADACFGSKITATFYRRGAFLAYTLNRKGGYCMKRDSLRAFAMVDGKKSTVEKARLELHNR
jgi:hypothetical protein